MRRAQTLSDDYAANTIGRLETLQAIVLPMIDWSIRSPSVRAMIWGASIGVVGLVFIFAAHHDQSFVIETARPGQHFALLSFINSIQGVWLLTTATVAAVAGTWFRRLSRILQMFLLASALGITFSAGMSIRSASTLAPWVLCLVGMVEVALVGSLFAGWWLPHHDFPTRAIGSVLASFGAVAAAYLIVAHRLPRLDDSLYFVSLSWPVYLASIAPGVNDLG